MKKTALILLFTIAFLNVVAQGSKAYIAARYSIKTHNIWGDWSRVGDYDYSCKLNYNKDKLPTDIVIRNYGLSHKGNHVIHINSYSPHNGKYYPVSSFTYKFEKPSSELTMFDDKPTTLTVSKVKGKFYVCMIWGEYFGMALYFQQYAI